ncbi:MAG: SpoIID/LytB domain-containing protein [Anaerolineae bacterium]|nr:SpoIID/LytB domain-containing protein [Anaerolineae bacterium]
MIGQTKRAKSLWALSVCALLALLALTGLLVSWCTPRALGQSTDLPRRITFDGHSTPAAWLDAHTVLVQRPGTVIDNRQTFSLWAVPLAHPDQARQVAQDALAAGAQAPALAYLVDPGGPSRELWLRNPETGESTLLLRGDLEHFDPPALSPDGARVALTRYATGSASPGDVWLIDADGGSLRPLAQTPLDEHSPVWSLDGTLLALVVSGDVWIVDPDHNPSAAFVTAYSQTTQQPNHPTTNERATFAPSNLTASGLAAPAFIRVLHDARNTCRSVPVGQIDLIPFEEYVRRVVPHEVPANWHIEALKAQAIAARTYAWRRKIDRIDWTYDVSDWTSDQVMCDSTHSRTDQAVQETEEQYLAYNNAVIYAFFCAETGSPTNYKQELNLAAAPYLRPIDDPVSFGQVRRGHSWGLSQEGAQRWASEHGWTYGQILGHYYSGAAVEGAGASPPLGSLLRPWHNFWVTSPYAWLQANAAGAAPLTVTFSARVADIWTTLFVDANGADGWGLVWPVGALGDTATPSIGVQLTVSDGVQTMTETERLFGLDRLPPTGTVTPSSQTVNTLTLTFAGASIVDPAPGSGPAGAMVSDERWLWEDTALTRLGGAPVSDPAAGDGSAWFVGAGQTGVLYGPYTPILPAGQYRALFRLKLPAPALTGTVEWAKLDVATNGGQDLLGIRYLRGVDFRAGDVYQEIAVDFVVWQGGTELEFRTDVSAEGAGLWLDHVRVFSYPAAAPPQWTLPAREGVITLTAKFADRAGNLSADAPLTVTLVDNSPPEGWRSLDCTESTCTLQMRDLIAGLNVFSAVYQYSDNEGIAWSGWLPATCSGVNGSQGWETVTAGGIPFGDGDPLQRRIQFAIEDAALAPSRGESPVYRAWTWRTYLPVVLRQAP